MTLRLKFSPATKASGIDSSGDVFIASLHVMEANLNFVSRGEYDMELDTK